MIPSLRLIWEYKKHNKMSDLNLANGYLNYALNTADVLSGYVTASPNFNAYGNIDADIIDLRSRCDELDRRVCDVVPMLEGRLGALEAENETLRRELRRCQTQVNNILAFLQNMCDVENKTDNENE
jgi:hypothetical protein